MGPSEGTERPRIPHQRPSREGPLPSGFWPWFSWGEKKKKPKEEAGLGATAYQAWRAQIGSISVTYTMEPMAFKAAQQPFPTWGGRRAQRKSEMPRARETPSVDTAVGSFQGMYDPGHLFCGPKSPCNALSNSGLHVLHLWRIKFLDLE